MSADHEDYLVPCIQGVEFYLVKVRAESARAATDLVKAMDGHYGCGITVAMAQEEDELRSLIENFDGDAPTYIAD